MSMIKQASDELAMLNLGHQLALGARAGGVIFLVGELGMGKTTLCRGIITALGYQGAVKSPTYTLVEPYPLGPLTVYHFDFYRLHHPEELEYMGIRDYFTPDSLCLIEWPERAGDWLPRADIVVTIKLHNQGRELHFDAQTQRGKAMVSKLYTGSVA